MMGISYGGISQLFTAQTQPPSLAAITPLSVIDATQTTLYPGGILNTGFAVEWAKDRIHDAKPAGPNDGQPWAYKRIQEGDQTCKANQALHGEAVDLIAKIRANDHYCPKVADPLSPVTFVDKIKVPTFMACQWTDEQTGGHCPTLASRFTGTNRKWFTFTNGTHVDSLGPETFNRWYDFLQLYVARQAPITNAAVDPGRRAGGLPGGDGHLRRDAAAAIRSSSSRPTRARSRRSSSSRRSASCSTTAPAARRRASRTRLRAVVPKLPDPGHDGPLVVPREPAARSPTSRPRARAPTRSPGTRGPAADQLHRRHGRGRERPVDRDAAVQVAAAAGRQRGVLRDGAADREHDRHRRRRGAGWVRSSAPNVDLQATISEVRPDGKETFVQGGWLRANKRKLDARKSTLLEPVLSLRAARRLAAAARPLRQGHDPALLPGPRLPRRLADPRDDHRPERRPADLGVRRDEPKGTATVAIAHSKRHAVAPGAAGRAGRQRADRPAACPGLRGEPCRDYQPFVNRT